jgi:hypothetical protein
MGKAKTDKASAPKKTPAKAATKKQTPEIALTLDGYAGDHAKEITEAATAVVAELVKENPDLASAKIEFSIEIDEKTIHHTGTVQLFRHEYILSNVS